MTGTSAPFPAYVTFVGDRVVDSASSAHPGMLRSLSRLAPVAVGVGVLTLITLLVVRAWAAYNQSLWVAIPIQLVGLPFVLGGTALWVQRPGNYLGPFCVLLGCVWYLGDLQAFDEEFLFVIGFSLYHLNVVVFAHLALMVPNGRLVGRLDRLIVIALYSAIPVTQFLRYLDVRPYIDTTTFGDVTAYYSSWARVATCVGAPLAAVAAARVVVHYRRAIPAQRRSFGLFWIAAAAAGGAAVAAAGLEFWPHELPQQIALLAYALALMAAAAGLVLGTVNIAASTRDAWRNLAGDVIDLERAIAMAVGDPQLRLYTWTDGGWIRGEAGSAGDPPTRLGPARTVLYLDDQPTALLVHDQELAYQRLLMQAVTAMTIAAIVRQRLAESRNRAMLDGQDAERARISRDLHDEAQTPLGVVIRGMTGIAHELPDDQPAGSSLLTLVEGAVQLRSRLKQIVDDLYPSGMSRFGLADAVAVRLRSIRLDPGEIDVIVDIPYERWPDRLELAAYFLISEALQNAIKHSGGSSVWISVRETGDALRVLVDDNGRGWPADSNSEVSGRGLVNMRTRVDLLNGELHIGRAPGGGGRVEALLPLPQNTPRSGRP
ncbi:MAG: sensor histidine kinase [Pseudonocardiaceae bacterium]